LVARKTFALLSGRCIPVRRSFLRRRHPDGRHAAAATFHIRFAAVKFS